MAGLAALFLPGLTAVQSLLVFWLGGAGLVLPLATLPGIRNLFTRELVFLSTDRTAEEEYQMWDDDIAREALVPAAKPMPKASSSTHQQQRKTG
ncbi:MAG: hypothetical protein AAGC81_10745 [Pseudomonadota bacterium]